MTGASPQLPLVSPGVILVVDDLEANRYVVARWLEGAGFRVATASTGEEALALAGGDVDLVLLDVNLPDLHGFEVAARLKSNPRTAHLPVLHLSADTISARDRVVGLEAGADGYLTQPVEPEELVANVRALLRLSETDRALRERNAEREMLLGRAETSVRELEIANALLQEQALELELTNQQLQENAVELETQAEALQETAAQLEERTMEAETARVRSEAVLASIADAFYLLDREWRFTHVNDPALELLKTSRDHLLGRTLWECFPDVIGSVFEGPYREAMAKGRPTSVEAWFEPLQTWFDVRTYPWAGGIMVHFRDVTDRKRGEVERERLLHEARGARSDAEHARMVAESASRAKGDFLAVMSHELRTPLNAIGGYAELIALGIRGPVTPEQSADLARIQQSQRHLTGLIDEVLTFAKLETGSVRYAVVDLPVQEALAGAEALVAPQARAKGLTLDVTSESSGLLVRADGEKLRQILVNLLSNAVKFTASGGRITLACTTRDGGMSFTVRDTGVGIPEDQLERIFEPFTQVRSELTRPHEGTGLGLAISRDLARGMDGELTVSSQLGVGSTFTLTLPGVPPRDP